MTKSICWQEMIEQYVHWNEDIGEWQLKCVAYTGNNMRKQSPQPEKSKVHHHNYTVSHEKRDTFIFSITQTNIDRFLYFFQDYIKR